MNSLLTTLPSILRKAYTGRSFALQLLAVALTYLIVVSGFDWLYFTSVRNQSLNAFFFPALPGGFFVPILVPVVLLVLGAVRKQQKLTLYGPILGQAAFLGWFISSVYKAFTGRVQPDLNNLLIDSSHSFQFGLLEHGIFWGWPSSHTAVAFSLAFATLTLVSKKNTFIRYMAIVYAVYVGIGVSLAIHWFSEFVAGAIIGSVIGAATGTVWKEKIP